MYAFEGNYIACSDNFLQVIRDNTLEDGAETSENNYDYTLYNIPDGLRYFLLLGASLISLITSHCFSLVTVKKFLDSSPQVNSYSMHTITAQQIRSLYTSDLQKSLYFSQLYITNYSCHFSLP